ncbi:hypothetical protein [Burkholderia metallica]|uniref:hypothetical protein n=1 Tax=Burkholderia metallica TaxID=488729 RepID=UPI0020C6E9E9|nr:hypothetical protein [Burkholderia metallica]
MEMLKRAWVGKERLWKVWWLIGAPLFVVNNVVIALLKIFAFSDPLGAPRVLVFGILVVLAADWLTWMWVAWRCAPNVDHQFWRGASRAALIGLILVNTAMTRQESSEFGDQLIDATLRGTQSAKVADSVAATPPATIPVEPVPAPAVATPAATFTAWDNGLGRAAFLDSHWHAMTPPTGARADTTYLNYEGTSDVAVVGRDRTRMSPRAFAAYASRHLGGYWPMKPPKSSNFDGHPVWSVLMRSAGQAAGVLFVFGDAQGGTWHVLTTSSVPDESFMARGLALDKAVLRSAF